MMWMVKIVKWLMGGAIRSTLQMEVLEMDVPLVHCGGMLGVGERDAV